MCKVALLAVMAPARGDNVDDSESGEEISFISVSETSDESMAAAGAVNSQVASHTPHACMAFTLLRQPQTRNLL